MRPYCNMLVALLSFVAVVWSGRSAIAVSLPLDQMAVPHFDVWSQLPPEVIGELRTLASAPQADVDRLLASADPREVGLGLFALDQQADLDRLITLVDLLDDPRLTIPFAAPTSGPNQFVPVSQTVGQYLSHIYHVWLGVPGHNAWNKATPDSLRASMEAIRGIRPWDRPLPWLQKMSRTSNSIRFSPDSAESVRQRLEVQKQQAEQLRSEVRWVVIAAGQDLGYYSREEAREKLLLLDRAVRDAIMTVDPIAVHDGEVGWSIDKNLANKARALLQPMP